MLTRRHPTLVPALAGAVALAGFVAFAHAGGQESGKSGDQPPPGQMQKDQPQPPSQGQQQPPQQPGGQATMQIHQVSGTVLDKKEVEVRGTEGKNLVVLLETDAGSRRMPIDLGPSKALKKLDVKKGQELTAEGPVVMMQEMPVMVAVRVKQNGKTVEIDRLSGLKKENGEPASTPPKSPQQ
jgi:hypothetical protein